MDTEPLLLQTTATTADADDADDFVVVEASQVPDFTSPVRRVSLAQGVLALFSTMIGGGMLTLPFATSKVGIFGSLLMSLACATINEATYYLLLVNARQTDSTSFHQVAKQTLGRAGSVVSMLCMIGITVMAAMSYLLLIGSLLGEVVYDERVTKPQRNLISAGFTCLVLFPLSLGDNMAALRHSNLVSALASLLLVFALVFELVVEPLEGGDDDSGVKLWPDSAADVVAALPFYLTAYTAHFSVISMDQELHRPTLGRARIVTRGAIGLAFILYSSLSISGYLFAKSATCDSILSNIPPRRAVSIVGRVGLTMTLCLSFPLFVLPCRATVCELVGWRNQVPSFQRRFLLTLAFCSVALTLCCIIPSVALAFSLTGSTLGVVIGLLLPSAFTLGNAKSSFGMRCAAWAIAGLGVAGLVLCSESTFRHRNDPAPCG